MEKEQYKILLENIREVGKRIDDLEKVVNDIKKDIGQDRIKIDNVVIAQTNLATTIGIMREDINNSTKDTQEIVKETMDDTLKPAIKSVDSLKKEIKNKKTIFIFKNKLTDWIKLKIRGDKKNE